MGISQRGKEPTYLVTAITDCMVAEIPAGDAQGLGKMIVLGGRVGRLEGMARVVTVLHPETASAEGVSIAHRAFDTHVRGEL